MSRLTIVVLGLGVAVTVVVREVSHCDRRKRGYAGVE